MSLHKILDFPFEHGGCTRMHSKRLGTSFQSKSLKLVFYIINICFFCRIYLIILFQRFQNVSVRQVKTPKVGIRRKIGENRKQAEK